MNIPLIQARTRMADTSLAIARIHHDLYGRNDAETQLPYKDEWFASLETRIFACLQETANIAHALGDLAALYDNDARWIHDKETT